MVDVDAAPASVVHYVLRRLPGYNKNSYLTTALLGAYTSLIVCVHLSVELWFAVFGLWIGGFE